MSTFNGFVALGTHLTDGILVSPLASAGYVDAAVAIDVFLSGVGQNNAQLAWGPCTADWGNLTQAALKDQQGNQLFTWSLSAPVLITVAGTTSVLMPSGALSVRLGSVWAADLVLTAGGAITYLATGEPARTS